MQDSTLIFEDTHAFQDDVLDRVLLNHIERDCVDTPEFRRLFRLAQLGLVHCLYPTANHTRGTHSIGVCVRAKRLVDHLNQNTARVSEARRVRRPDELTLPKITRSERCLISLAALLHDLPHSPLSHDLEKKTHRYGVSNKLKLRSHYGPFPKHDDCERNPALYVILFDTRRSVLARVLETHSPAFWKLLRTDASTNDHLKDFVEFAASCGWRGLTKKILPSLLFHLLVFEDIETAASSADINVLKSFGQEKPKPWGIGPTAHWKRLHHSWYQPFRHDIVGNTLSADLLDYLARDAKRLGMANVFDPKLLEYYVLVTQPVSNAEASNESRNLTRCAIDLNDYKRGRIRSERINDVFRLLDFRHEIHEKAIHHRIVQAAIAMLSRALMLADNPMTLETLYAVGEPHHVVAGDDRFLHELANSETENRRRYHFIGQKLVERRLYRPLMMIPGDDAETLLDDTNSSHAAGNKHDAKLRELGAILDSKYFAPLFCLICWCVERLLDHSFESTEALNRFIQDLLARRQFDRIRSIVPSRVILWTTPYKQLYKDPALVVRAGECVDRIDRLALSSDSALPPTVHARLEAGMKDAESRYASMWTVYAFISDGLYYSGGLARLLKKHECRHDSTKHVKHLAEAQDELLRAIRVAWTWYKNKEVAGNLVDRISNDDLEQLLSRFLAYTGEREKEKFAEEAAHRRKLCGVDLRQYIHDEPGIGCKDVRYRFDNAADLDRAIDDAGLNKEQSAAARAFLRAVKLDISEIGHEELADIMFHMGQVEELMDLLVSDKAAREGDEFADSDLRKTWFEVELTNTAGENNGPEANRDVPSVTPAQKLIFDPSEQRSGHRRQRSATRAREAES